MFGLVAAMDWIADRPQTMLNVFGDTIACAITQISGLKHPLRVQVDEESPAPKQS